MCNTKLVYFVQTTPVTSEKALSNKRILDARRKKDYLVVAAKRELRRRHCSVLLTVRSRVFTEIYVDNKVTKRSTKEDSSYDTRSVNIHSHIERLPSPPSFFVN